MEWKKSSSTFKTLDGGWGYNWVDFDIDGQHFLGYADHTSPSGLMIWNGQSFRRRFQEFSAAGRARLRIFSARIGERPGSPSANLTGESFLYRWHGGPFRAASIPWRSRRAREFAVAQTAQALYPRQNQFHSWYAPAAPKTDLKSCIYQWKDGQTGGSRRIPRRSGGTDAAVFAADGATLPRSIKQLEP